MAYKRISPIPVIEGASGLQSSPAYFPIVGGTSSTSSFQNPSSLGTSGQVLTSNGSSSLPTFEAPSSGGSWVLISDQTVSATSSIQFTSIGSYDIYFLIFRGCGNNTNTSTSGIQVSDDNGSSYITTNYQGGLDRNGYDNTPPGNDNSTTLFPISGPTTNTNNYTSLKIMLSGLNQGSGIPVTISGNVTYKNSSGGGPKMVIGRVGGRSSTAGGTLNAFRYLASSGTVNGNFRLYGIAN